MAGRPNDGAAPWARTSRTKQITKRSKSGSPGRLVGRQKGVPGQDGWVMKDDDGDKPDPDIRRRCIFLNSPDFEGGGGCRYITLRWQGRQTLEVKPDVCWQLPIRRTSRAFVPDGKELSVVVVSEFDRRGWGPPGTT